MRLTKTGSKVLTRDYPMTCRVKQLKRLKLDNEDEEDKELMELAEEWWRVLARPDLVIQRG